jgi:hypothetical protein
MLQASNMSWQHHAFHKMLPFNDDKELQGKHNTQVALSFRVPPFTM